MSSTLNLHAGGHVCTKEELALYVPPPPTATWYPHSHVETINLVETILDSFGYRIAKQRLAIDKAGARFFSTIDLESEVVPGLTLAVGVRNSYDMSYPFGMVGGSRTFVCSNLSFSGDLINVRSKHTKNGRARFERHTQDAIGRLEDFRKIEARKIETYKETEIDDRTASAILFQSFLRDVVSNRILKAIWKEWEEPSHDFGPCNLFRLMQAFTTCLRDRSDKQPVAFSRQTIRLHALLGEFASKIGFDTPDLVGTAIEVPPKG